MAVRRFHCLDIVGFDTPVIAAFIPEHVFTMSGIVHRMDLKSNRIVELVICTTAGWDTILLDLAQDWIQLGMFLHV